ncbi:MAG TPA: hypothetical protein DDX54_01450 [Rhodospirillaceae bacterium]|nr:hypothetical protein [Rhodospirillaceae bacterium]
MRALKSRAKPYKVSDTHGLFVLVTPAEAKLWRYKYKFHRPGQDGPKEYLMALGDFDDGRGVTLAEARRRRDAARALVKQGVDPVAARANARATQRAEAENTFAKVALRWLDGRRGAINARTYTAKRARLEAYVFPAF